MLQVNTDKMEHQWGSSNKPKKQNSWQNNGRKWPSVAQIKR